MLDLRTYLLIFARIEDDKNITGFIVENDPANGISLGEEEHKLGIHSSSTRQVFFNETKVPVENMLSERRQWIQNSHECTKCGENQTCSCLSRCTA